MQSNKSNGQLTAQINVSDHKKSGFDLSNNVLGTGKIGRIIPTRALHVMPGDTIKQDSKCAVQFEPLAVPILANMDVKQEHFYVPYNIVWKNWDKFISGGEKMDYQGVVPNVSIRSIVKCVNDLMSDQGDGVYAKDAQMNPLCIPLSSDGVDYTRLNLVISTIETDFASFREAVSDLKYNFNANDLLNPLDVALDRLESFVKDMQNEIYFTRLDFATNPNSKQGVDAISTYIENELGDSKYVKPLIKALSVIPDKEYFYKEGSYYLFMPSEPCLMSMILMYDFFRPLVGLSSNIDYLNMGRITLTDFIYSIILSVSLGYKVFTNSEDYTHMPCEVEAKFDSNYFSDLPLSILNLRANYSIWYNNYRDILLEEKALEPSDGDSVSDVELFNLLLPRQRCWEKDAFTTALDTPGTGNVGVPLNFKINETSGYSTARLYEISKINNLGIPSETNDDMSNVAQVTLSGESWSIPTSFLSGVNPLDDPSRVMPVQGFSLYSLDAAQRAQKWLQKALFFGNRISDFYYLHFGVRHLDARLHLPELLSSSSELVRIDAIMNNTTTAESIAGDRAGFASAYDNGNSFERFCEEHGVIMSYLTIMPQVTYAYGMSRDYSRLDQFDFAFSEFATLGMDAVYDTEITACPIDYKYRSDADAQVFGYQGKYYDYKAKHSEEHGELLDSQDMYTFARKFNMYSDERPKLNYEFVHCFPDLDMFVVDDPTQDYFRYDIRHSTAAERNLPSQSIYI